MTSVFLFNHFLVNKNHLQSWSPKFPSIELKPYVYFCFYSIKRKIEILEIGRLLLIFLSNSIKSKN